MGCAQTFHGLRPNFSRGSLREPRKLAALRAGKNDSLAAPITLEAALDSQVPAALPARSQAVAWA